MNNLCLRKKLLTKMFVFFVGIPEKGYMMDALRGSNHMISICHAHDLFYILYFYNLAEWKKNGRIKEYKLTKKGLELQKLMKLVLKDIDDISPEKS